MYTNGLKDRFGSPLVSQRDVEQQIVEPLEAINVRLTTTEENLSKVSEDLKETREEIEEISSKSYAYTDSENTFTENNTFVNELTLSAGANSDGSITVN